MDLGLTSRTNHNRRSATLITVILVSVRGVAGHRVYDVAVLANLRNIVVVFHQFTIPNVKTVSECYHCVTIMTFCDLICGCKLL